MATTKQRPNIQSVQCWPSGKTLYYSGDPHGPTLRVHKNYRTARGRKPAEGERRAIQVELRVKSVIDQDIYCCDSMLVTELMKSSEYGDEFSYENVSNLRPDPSDWTIEQCKEWLEDEGHELPNHEPVGDEPRAVDRTPPG
jgi:hypothetical protein